MHVSNGKYIGLAHSKNKLKTFSIVTIKQKSFNLLLVYEPTWAFHKNIQRPDTLNKKGKTHLAQQFTSFLMILQSKSNHMLQLNISRIRVEFKAQIMCHINHEYCIEKRSSKASAGDHQLKDLCNEKNLYYTDCSKSINKKYLISSKFHFNIKFTKIFQ